MPSLDGATEWLNSPPLSPAGLRGRVVLVDFWTYTCINWLRTLPYVRAWAEKYGEHGLVVLGVHTPEFRFEHDVDNIRWNVDERGIEYPVAVDSDYRVWRAFANNYWPALYFVDKEGAIRHHHFGEGRYDESERVIQQLLGVEGELVSVEGSGAEAEADWQSLGSPETYLGYERTENFASLGEARVYAAPERLQRNHWALSGDWTVGADHVLLNEAGGRIAFRFEARDVHLVMGPATRGASVRFRVLVDGQPPTAANGADVDEAGNGTVVEQRLYQLIRQRSRVEERTFEIEFVDPGVEAYAFTFG
jgi:thiol-disulfide isomerase/thioredoxin